MNSKISLIYCTCDRYESLWTNFFRLWKKYWPTFDAQVILNTETNSFSFAGLEIKRPIFSKTHLTWSERLYESLETVQTPYVILTLDDFYLKSFVDVDTIELCVKKMDEDSNVGVFTFAPQPGNNNSCDFSDRFEKRARMAPYRINAQMGLWRVSYLKSILRMYENPWEFELNGSFRSMFSAVKLYSLKKGVPFVFDYDWGFLIVRGQLNREVAEYFIINEKLEFDESFTDIDMNAYRALGQNKKGRLLRILKYLYKMILSLFRK